MKRLLSLVAIIAVILLVVHLDRKASAAAARPLDLEGSLLNVKIPDYVESEMVDYTGMTISFNPEAHQANWVAWELTAEEAQGEEPRNGSFQQDTRVKGCPSPADYRHSGYDRGHLAPAGDMKWSPEAMRESFMMTNISPQAHTLNAGAWKKLEEKCRQWARRDSVLYIVCGPVLTDEVTERIGPTGVIVPQRFFKVVLAPYANPPRGIGFIMPNGAVEGGMQRAVVSIDDVEAVTGFDFFSALPDSIEAIVESRADFNGWNRPR